MTTKEYIASFVDYTNEDFNDSYHIHNYSGDSLNYIVDEFANECEIAVNKVVKEIKAIHEDFLQESSYGSESIFEDEQSYLLPIVEMAMRANTVEELESVLESVEEYEEMFEAAPGRRVKDNLNRTAVDNKKFFSKAKDMIVNKAKALKNFIAELFKKKKAKEEKVKNSNASPEKKKSWLKQIGEWFSKAKEEAKKKTAADIDSKRLKRKSKTA